MEQDKTGGPAFPGFNCTEGRGNQRRNEHSGEWETHEQGMSLRDYFAAHIVGHCLGVTSEEKARAYAENAYLLADAMLVARDK